MKGTIIKLLILSLEFWLGITATAISQETPMEKEQPRVLEPVIVTATASPTRLSDTTASVTVITREQIEAQHAVRVIEVLRQVPGL